VHVEAIVVVAPLSQLWLPWRVLALQLAKPTALMQEVSKVWSQPSPAAHLPAAMQLVREILRAGPKVELGEPARCCRLAEALKCLLHKMAKALVWSAPGCLSTCEVLLLLFPKAVPMRPR